MIAAGSIWIVLDNSGPAAWDQSRHARNALAMLDILRDAGGRHSLFDFLYYYDFYPPLSYLPTVLFHLIFGREYDVACFSTLLFWIPLLFLSTVAVGRRLMGARAGWLAGSAILCLPSVVALSKDYLTDLQTGAMTSVAMWGLLRSNLLLTPRRSRVVQAGLILGACMLTKWSMPAFLAGPVLIASIRGLRRQPARFIGNAMLAGGIAALMVLPWYFPNRRDIVRALFFSVEYGGDLGYPDPLSLSSFLWYARALVESHLTLPVVILFAGGMAVLAKRRKPVLVLLLLSLSLSWLVLTVMRNKEARFAMAFLPYVCWVIAGTLSRPKQRTGVWVAGVLAAVGVFSLSGVLFRLPVLPERVGGGFYTLLNQEPYWWSQPPAAVAPDPAKEAEQLFRSLWTCLRPREHPQAGVVDVRLDHTRIDPYRIDYYAVLNHRAVRVLIGPDAPFLDSRGWPPAGPGGAEFVIVPGRDTEVEDYQPLALLHNPGGILGGDVKLMNSTQVLGDSKSPRVAALFADPEYNNAACLLSSRIIETAVSMGGRSGLQLEWMVGSRGVGHRFEYVRQVQANGPSPFRLEWIGPSTWATGERKTETVQLQLPDSITPGDYDLVLSLLRRPKRHDEKPLPTRLVVIGKLAESSAVPLGRIRIR